MGTKKEKLERSTSYWLRQPGTFSRMYSSRNPLFFFSRLFLKKRMDVVERFLGQECPRCVALDAGCGSGELAAVLTGRFAKVIGVDYSPIMIGLAKKRTAGMENIEFYTADCAHIPLPSDSVDYLFALGVLDYIDDPAASLKEFSRVLKHKGTIIFTLPKTPSFFAFLRWSSNFRYGLFHIPPLVTIVSKRQLLSLAEGCGMNIQGLFSLWTTMWIVCAQADKAGQRAGG